MTETVQLVVGATEAPAKLTVDEPFAAVTVPPLQVVVGFPGVATTKPPGKVSVNATPVCVRF